MAANPGAARLTETHRQTQARLAATVVTQVLAAWVVLDPDDLDGTTGPWVEVLRPLIAAGRRQSAALAATYLTTFRSLELGTLAGARTVLADQVDPRALLTSLIVTGPAAIRSARARGVVSATAIDTARAGVARAAMRHALGGGRDTITATVDADPRARGWARATSGRACGFCAMLAGRGPVYRGESSARFEAHDGCNCTAEPVYRSDAPWPAGSRRYAELWAQAKGEAPGGGQEVVNAFRRTLAG